MVNGLLAAQDGIEGLALRIGCQFSGHLGGILGLGIDPHGFMGTDGQRLAEDGVAIRTAHGGNHDFSSLCLHDFEGADERVPLVVGIDDELDPFLIEAGVALGERDARRGVRGLADADEKFHAFALKVGDDVPVFGSAKLTPEDLPCPRVFTHAFRNVTLPPSNKH